MDKVEEFIGKQIDQFKIEDFIARGAMGMVFKAFDSVLARVVALKLISKTSEGALEDAEILNREIARKRLIQEAKAAGKLAHPNIVTIHSYGETDELLYICMEYIKGKTLGQILKEQGPLSVKEAIPIIEQILLALDAADKEDIVHRDIKPSNIMITEDNRLKVTDFGIAKLPSLSMTVTGMVLGTPYYMSPEQISGKKVDIRSDIFSLGAVFYELLTGQKPFEAESTATLVYKIIQVDPIPPRELNIHIPQSVVRIASKALAKDPEQRYQKPMEMLKDLRALSSLTTTDADAETVVSFQTSHDKIGPAEKPGIDIPSEQETSADAPALETNLQEEASEEEKQEKPKHTKKAAIALCLALILSAAAIALWSINRGSPERASLQTVPRPSGTTQSVQPLTEKNQLKSSIDSLLLEAGRQFTSDPEAAQNTLEKALSMDPNHYDCVLALARLLAYKKNYPAAIQRYQQALSIDNRASDVHYELGSLLLGQGSWNEAIQALEASLVLMPRNRDEVLANLGFCHFKKGNFTQAQLLFKQSLELNPNNATAKAFMASMPVTPPQTDTPPSKDPARTPGIKLERKYLVNGSNPNGVKYRGTATITRSGDKYAIIWTIAGQILTGSGTLSGSSFTVTWKDPGTGAEKVIVYGISPNGTLKGTWGGSGKGSETLTPVETVGKRSSGTAKRSQNTGSDAGALIRSYIPSLPLNDSDLSSLISTLVPPGSTRSNRSGY